MDFQCKLKKSLVIIAIINVLLLMSTCAYAETKKISGEYRYQASELDSKDALQNNLNILYNQYTMSSCKLHWSKSKSGMLCYSLF